MNIAVIKAGGVGSRAQQGIPKQFVEVANKPIVVWTIEKFANNRSVDEIVVICLRDYQDKLRGYLHAFNITKHVRIIDGGETNVDSIYHSYVELEKFAQDDDIIIMQDGVRPMISDEIIERVLDGARENGNSFAAMPINSGIVLVSQDGKISQKYLKRNELYITETDGISYKNLTRIHDKLYDWRLSHVTLLDVMIDAGMELHMVEGDDKNNLKITTPDDVEVFRAICEGSKND